MSVFLVSDVHLSARRPERVAAFLSFLGTRARGAQRLYILGDLFDLWLGDDDTTPPHPAVLDALSRLTDSGTAVYALHGNHDFLMGPGFETHTGCRLLPDPWVANIYGRRVLLSHGDRLCSDDLEYQRWRASTRDPEHQRAFLAQPLAARSERAARIRKHSVERARLKPQDILDVSQQAVVDAMRAHGVDCLVHGHTHRPAVHRLSLDGRPGVRIVLGDWYEGDVLLRWDERGYRLAELGSAQQTLIAHKLGSRP